MSMRVATCMVQTIEISSGAKLTAKSAPGNTFNSRLFARVSSVDNVSRAAKIEKSIRNGSDVGRTGGG